MLLGVLWGVVGVVGCCGVLWGVVKCCKVCWRVLALLCRVKDVVGLLLCCFGCCGSVVVVMAMASFLV